MKAGVRAVDFSARLAVVLTALLLIWFGRPAGAAQDCKSLPPGPEKKQCLMQSHPEAFQKKQERCKTLAQQRGSFAGKGRETGQMDFMQSCMQGKTS